MNINLRAFRPQDQADAKALILRGLGEHFGRINPELNPDLNDIYQAYIQAGNYFVVIEDNAQIIATAALVLESSHNGRIVRMSVHPEYRRLGIGRILVDHLLQTAIEKQLSRVLVETNLDWFDAIRLYERCGFEEYGRDSESVHLSLTLSRE